MILSFLPSGSTVEFTQGLKEEEVENPTVIEFWQGQGFNKRQAVYLTKSFRDLIVNYQLVLSELIKTPCYTRLALELEGLSLAKSLSIFTYAKEAATNLEPQQALRDLLTKCLAGHYSLMRAFNSDCWELFSRLSPEQFGQKKGILFNSSLNQSFYKELPIPLLFLMRPKFLKIKGISIDAIKHFLIKAIGDTITRALAEPPRLTNNPLPRSISPREYNRREEEYLTLLMEELMLNDNISASAIADYFTLDFFRRSHSSFCRLLKLSIRPHRGHPLRQVFHKICLSLQLEGFSYLDKSGSELLAAVKKALTEAPPSELELRDLGLTVDELILIYTTVIPFLGLAKRLRGDAKFVKPVIAVRAYAYLAVRESFEFIFRGYNFERFLDQGYTVRQLKELKEGACYLWVVLTNYCATNSTPITRERHISLTVASENYLRPRFKIKPLPKKIASCNWLLKLNQPVIICTTAFRQKEHILLCALIMRGVVSLKSLSAYRESESELTAALLRSSASLRDWLKLLGVCQFDSALLGCPQVKRLISTSSLGKVFRPRIFRNFNSLFLSEPFLQVLEVYKPLGVIRHHSRLEITKTMFFREKLDFRESLWLNEIRKMDRSAKHERLSFSVLTASLIDYYQGICYEYLATRKEIEDKHALSYFLMDALALNVAYDLERFIELSKKYPTGEIPSLERAVLRSFKLAKLL